MSILRTPHADSIDNAGHGMTQRDKGTLRSCLDLTRSRHGQVLTNWIVITGAPGTGKTTLIDALAKRGCAVVPDAGRQVLLPLVRKGLSKRKARGNYLGVQHAILERMLAIADAIDPNIQTFFDYAPPDNLAFLKLRNLEWPIAFLKAACRYRYSHAFLLGNVVNENDRDVHPDPVRIETSAQRVRLTGLIRDIYESLGVPVTQIVEASIEKRLDIVEERCSR